MKYTVVKSIRDNDVLNPDNDFINLTEKEFKLIIKCIQSTAGFYQQITIKDAKDLINKLEELLK